MSNGWQHIEDTTPVARKDYRCELCGTTISKGTKYVMRFGFDDEGPVRFRMHAECKAQTKDWDETDWECFSIGDTDPPPLTRRT